MAEQKLTLLKVLRCEVRDLAAPQTTRQHDRQNCAVAAALQALGVRRQQQSPALVRGQQFPRRTPTRLAPFTRRIPAASSGLSSPVSAAS
jgi:hypothetical protein